MSELSKQAGMLSATEFFRFFVKSIIGIALARLITPAELGSYRQLFLIYSTFSTLLLLGIPQSLLYFLPKSKTAEDQKRIISRTLNIVSLLALIFAIAIFALKGFIAVKFNNPSLRPLLLIYAIYPLFIFITQLFSSIMLGLKRPLQAAKFTLFAVFTDFVLILGVAYF
ncbi:MAG: oligosaccharide flippase family protein, partial [Candidatus Cloacimonetes bacterium]|nr:oligosaccharide flippase family protein [Candidatus Cloacimonadota bacterium]